MLDKFIVLIRQWINTAIYVWGGQGHLITSESQIRSMETSTTNANRAIALWIKRGRSSIAFDCSGLIIWALQEMGLISYDTTADGIYDKSIKIEKTDLRMGDFTVRINDETGNANHIGIVTRIVNGVPWVTEAMGRDDGVVERAIDASQGYWERFIRNPFIDTLGGQIMSYTTLSHGDTGALVLALQQKLETLGYEIGNIAGNFLDKTDAAVRAFQTEYRLTVDGVAGPQTQAALDEAIRAREVQAPVDYKPALDEANKQIDQLEAEKAQQAEHIAFLTNEIGAGQLRAEELKTTIAKLQAENDVMLTDLRTQSAINKKYEV